MFDKYRRHMQEILPCMNGPGSYHGFCNQWWDKERRQCYKFYLACMEMIHTLVSAVYDGTNKGDKCQEFYLACMELCQSLVSALNDGARKGHLPEVLPCIGHMPEVLPCMHGTDPHTNFCH